MADIQTSSSRTIFSVGRDSRSTTLIPANLQEMYLRKGERKRKEKVILKYIEIKEHKIPVLILASTTCSEKQSKVYLATPTISEPLSKSFFLFSRKVPKQC
jgi:hypothetical protein